MEEKYLLFLGNVIAFHCFQRVILIVAAQNGLKKPIRKSHDEWKSQNIKESSYWLKAKMTMNIKQETWLVSLVKVTFKFSADMHMQFNAYGSESPQGLPNIDTF